MKAASEYYRNTQLLAGYLDNVLIKWLGLREHVVGTLHVVAILHHWKVALAAT